MPFHSSRPMPAQPQACWLCHAPLASQPTPQDRLCGRPECAWRYSVLRQQQRLCKVCQRPLTDQELPAKLCAAPECQHAAIADTARQDRERNEARREVLLGRATQWFEQVVNNFGIADRNSFPVALVPACTVDITPLPPKRRREFRDYLKGLIAQVVAFPSPGDTALEKDQEPIKDSRHPRILKALGQGCACCKGSCCQGGGFSHAYLTVEKLRRHMALHPEQSPRQVLAAYLSHVGERTYAGSCVYHQADGCSLPRDLRADLCNLFFCGALLEFEQKLSVTGPVRAFLVSADHAIQRAALVHQDQMLMMSAPPADSD